MENIIEPIDRELLKAELSKEKKLRDTNKGGNEIYIVTCNDAPNVLKEIGRLREISFRASGGAPGFLWISIILILWKILAGSLFCGILMRRKS